MQRSACIPMLSTLGLLICFRLGFLTNVAGLHCSAHIGCFSSPVPSELEPCYYMVHPCMCRSMCIQDHCLSAGRWTYNTTVLYHDSNLQYLSSDWIFMASRIACDCRSLGLPSYSSSEVSSLSSFRYLFN